MPLNVLAVILPASPFSPSALITVPDKKNKWEPLFGRLNEALALDEPKERFGRRRKPPSAS